MNKEQLINSLKDIDALVLSKCVNPALSRQEHEAVKQTMHAAIQRVALSYTLEEEKERQSIKTVENMEI